jgi:hypothetical protein
MVRIIAIVLSIILYNSYQDKSGLTITKYDRVDGNHYIILDYKEEGS